MTEPAAGEATRILQQLSAGDQEAADRLLGLVYDELRRTAGALMQREGGGHTLQPTALVNEAYLKLIGPAQAAWQDRDHFLGVAARAMRQVLVDHARAKSAAKRGGRGERLELDGVVQWFESSQVDILALHEALEDLARQDPDAAQVVELRFFGGLTLERMAALRGVSISKVERTWQFARAWLRRHLSRE